MRNISLRPLDPKDLDQLVQLVATRDEMDIDMAKKRVEMMAWLAFNNPFAGAETTYYIAEDKDRIVGYQGRMPVQMCVNGETVRGYYPHDLYVDPSQRKKGQGFWLSMAFAEIIEKESDSFICHFGMTPLNTAIQRKRGYYETTAQGYIKLINSHFVLRKYLRSKLAADIIAPVFNGMLRLMDKIPSLLVSQSLSLLEVSRFDDRFDAFAQRNKKYLGNSTIRNTSYLNWKYVDCPSDKQKIFAVADDQQVIKGYIVLSQSTPFGKEQEKAGVILDIVTEKGQKTIAVRLIKAAIDYFRSQNTHCIKCVMSDVKYVKVLKRFLFMKKPGKTVLLGNVDRLPMGSNQEKLKDIENWHMTLSEGDANLFSF